MTRYYRVAEHIFSIDAPEAVFAQLPNYAPFELSTSTPYTLHSTPLVAINVQEGPLLTADNWAHVYTDSSEEEMPRVEMYRRDEEWLFRVALTQQSEVVSTMRCSADWHQVDLYLLPEYVRFAIDNAAMLVFSFASASCRTLLFHSSVTVKEGTAYMFLGHSGTGKSTHSEQWKKAFPEVSLLNDDNPAVRILSNGEVRVYGSPWSGKTPCYKNESAPVGALVQLAQAPENKIERLRMTQAYPYILSSISGLKTQAEMMDQLYQSIAALLETTPVYRLECLPNPDAARLCAQTCSPSPDRTDN